MKATSRFAPSANSPLSVELPSASTCSDLTRSPRPTIGFWWISVPWLERMNFVMGYSCLPSFVSSTIRSASTSTTVPASSARTTSPVSVAARNSRPVPTSGACVIISGTACRCMFAPMSARFASLCSRNGISAVATETICAGAERREPPPVREPGERVGLVHELRELRGAEELLQRRDHGPDVDDRLRRDRVDVLGGHPLADDALHPVEADPERLLDQLADRAESPVAEVLVLVKLAANRVAVEHDRVGGEVLRLRVDAQHVGQLDQLADEREDVRRRQDADVVA